MLIPSQSWNDNIAIDTAVVKSNLKEIQENIAHYKIKIIAVTKYYGLGAIEAGYEAGIRDFGESRAVESIKKINSLSKEIRENSAFHFIGHLQSNKAEMVVENFDVIHSIDSLKIASAVSRAACSINKREKVLLQVNNSGEEQKFGYTKEQLKNEFSSLSELDGLEIIGLMCMAPLGADKQTLGELFSDIYKFRNELENKFGTQLPELSMGMSDDYLVAAEEGATIIRIGRKLFT